ncbi:MAG: methylmalonyl-CoA mutase family protein, partial [bacterium]
SGYFQREIHQAAYGSQKDIEEGRQTIVGVNRFAEEEETSEGVEILKVDPAQERDQVEGLARLRAERDPTRTDETLAALTEAARGSQNLMPLVMEAIDAEATLGEVSDALREVWGTFDPPGGL